MLPFLRIIVVFLALHGTLFSILKAQVITSDGLLDTQVIQNGDTHNITGGRRSGSNLFHSFEEFGVPTGNIANFLNDSGLPTSNILSRVTGGSSSNILGMIQTEGFGRANLFLMNPAGIVFGQGATMNVGGAVHFTTADYLQFGDGVQFTALQSPQDALLSISPVVAFGFLGTNPSAILAKGSTFTIEEGEALSLVGGNVELSGGTLSAPDGQINLVSLHSPGTVLLGEGADIQVNGRQLGQIELTGNTSVNVNGESGGTIVVRGGRLMVDGSQISANADGSSEVAIAGASGGGIDIETSEDVILSNRSLIAADVGGLKDGGSIRITTDESLGIRNSILRTLASPGTDGKAGNIEVDASNVIFNIDSGPQQPFEILGISSATLGNGDSGSIKLKSNNLGMFGGFIATVTGGGGQAGNVELIIENDLAVIGNPLGGGNIVTNAIGGTGSAGDILITASDLALTGDSQIQALTAFAGDAGTIQISLNGKLSLQEASSISSESIMGGSAGDITIMGKDIFLSGVADSNTGDQTEIAASTTGDGQGGNIKLDADQIQVENLARVTAETAGKGKAGNISLTGDQLSVTSGGRVEASTSGQGAGGTIKIVITDDTIVSGVSSDDQTRSGIFAKTQSSGGGTGGGGGGSGGGSSGGGSGSGGGGAGSGGGGSGSGGGSSGRGSSSSSSEETVVQSGDAGGIEITTKNLLLNGGGQIDSSTTSGGAGGSVSITATDKITVEGVNSRVTSDASRGNGPGGSISLNVTAGDLTVRDGGSVTAQTGGTGDAGEIAFDVGGTLSVVTGGTINTSTSGAGQGGKITAQADRILLDGVGSSIAADTLPPFADLTVLLSLLHQPDSDLTVQLDSPSGTRLALFSQVGGNGQNFIDTLLSDSANQPITAGSPPFTGPFRPREPLAQLIGEPLNGTWTLNVRDRMANNGTAGFLQSWALQTQDNSLTFSPTDLPKNVVDNGSIQSSVLVNSGPDAVVQGTGEASGDGGDIVLNAQSIAIQNGATVSANNTGSGQGGTVEITTSDGVLLSGKDSGLLSNATGSGPGGSIGVQAENIALRNDATISAASSGAGDAGSVNLMADDAILLDNSTVTTVAEQTDGGNIKLTASDIIQLTNSQISSSVGGGESTVGGNINLDPEFIILKNSQILANAFEGQGGSISLIADNAVIVDPLSVLDASSALGVSGSVDIQAPIQNLSGTIAPLPEESVPVTALYSARCAAGQGGHFSTFVDSKADSLSPRPSVFLASPLPKPSVQKSVADRVGDKHIPLMLTASLSPLVFGESGERTACP